MDTYSLLKCRTWYFVIYSNLFNWVRYTFFEIKDFEEKNMKGAIGTAILFYSLCCVVSLPLHNIFKRNATHQKVCFIFVLVFQDCLIIGLLNSKYLWSLFFIIYILVISCDIKKYKSNFMQYPCVWKTMALLFANLSYEIVYDACIMIGYGYYARIFKHEFV